jgi:hypothetical protein
MLCVLHVLVLWRNIPSVVGFIGVYTQFAVSTAAWVTRCNHKVKWSASLQTNISPSLGIWWCLHTVSETYSSICRCDVTRTATSGISGARALFHSHQTTRGGVVGRSSVYPRRLRIITEVFRDFSRSLHTNTGILDYFKLGQDWFVPYSR